MGRWIKFGKFKKINKPKKSLFDKEAFLLEITESYIYEYKGKEYTVPKGFITDGASIPDILEPLAGDNYQDGIETINMRGNYVPAAFIHDYTTKMGTEGTPVCSWSDAHKMFYHAMLDHGVPKRGRLVKCFGDGAWMKYQAVKMGMFFRRWKYPCSSN